MGHRDRVDNLRTRATKSDDITDADGDALLAFSDELFLLKTNYTDARHEKLLRHCTRIAEEVGGLADSLEQRDAAEEIVRWINRTYDNEETNRDYRVAFRVFGRRTVDENGDEPPESIDWVPSGTSKSYNPSPNPGDMLYWDDHVLPMVDATYNARDAAMIAVAWDAGCRSGEFQDLTVGDVTDHKHGMQVTVDGKTGQRTVTLIPSVPYLQRWLTEHPDRGDSTAPLWTKLSRSESISYRMMKKAFEQAAGHADIDRPVTLTNFRKSSASYLASQGMSQAHLEKHHGWVRGSSVASRYVAVFAEAADNELARIHGLDVSEDEPDPVGPVTCPRCDKETPREKDFCVWCGQALEPEAVDRLEQNTRKVERLALGMMQDDPSLIEDVQKREQILSAVEDDPELRDRAQKLIDELRD